MEEINKKVKGNAVAAYFMVFVSVFFLMSKKPYVNHPFVKSHVKSALTMQSIFLVMLYIMSYSFLDYIDIFGYTLNTIITAAMSLIIFGGILYGMYMAHNGKTVTVGEIFHSAGIGKDVISTSKTKKISEHDSLILILAHIPFLGYIIYPRYKNIAHIRDVTQLNIIVTLLSVLILIGGYTSLASLTMLAYIIYSVFQSIRLSIQDEIETLNLDSLPTSEEKYILQKSLYTYITNSLRKKAFSPLSQIVKEKQKLRYEDEKKNIEHLRTLSSGKIPGSIFYIPVLNFIGIFFLKSQDSYHIKNGLILSIIFIIVYLTLGWDSPVLILFLFPISYGIGYIERKAYKMPYIYDIYSFFAHIVSSIGKVLHITRKLQKTTTKTTIKIGETPSQQIQKK